MKYNKMNYACMWNLKNQTNKIEIETQVKEQTDREQEWGGRVLGKISKED